MLSTSRPDPSETNKATARDTRAASMVTDVLHFGQEHLRGDKNTALFRANQTLLCLFCKKPGNTKRHAKLSVQNLIHPSYMVRTKHKSGGRVRCTMQIKRIAACLLASSVHRLLGHLPLVSDRKGSAAEQSSFVNLICNDCLAPDSKTASLR